MFNAIISYFHVLRKTEKVCLPLANTIIIASDDRETKTVRVQQKFKIMLVGILLANAIQFFFYILKPYNLMVCVPKIEYALNAFLKVAMIILTRLPFFMLIDIL